ncbi:hypothetical protein BJV78DRAFT_1163805, partial [Lactifluus subvellereus]
MGATSLYFFFLHLNLIFGHLSQNHTSRVELNGRKRPVVWRFIGAAQQINVAGGAAVKPPTVVLFTSCCPPHSDGFCYNKRKDCLVPED